MSHPRLTFHGGVNEIGGNKIVVEDGPDRLLFDFGPSFSPRFDEYWMNWLQPRSTSPVKDLLEFDLLPRIDGLYSADALAGSDLKYEAPRFHGVFVSHAHADHAGHLDLIDPEIPVYVGETTRGLLSAIESSTSQKYGSHPYRIVAEGAAVRVGQMEVVPVPVDHSIPGAMGFLIRTSEGTVAYTGDFRRHGPRGAATDAFIARATEERPEALIIEGTRAGPDARRNLSESQVRDGVGEILGATKDLAVVSCYPRDVDRLTSLYDSARAAERDFVVSLKTAHLLKSLAGQLPAGAPVPGQSEGLRVYLRPKKTYYKWERPFIDEGVDSEFVRTHGRELLLQLDLLHFAELIDLRPPRGSPFIHSMSEPFSEDDVDDQILNNWLDHFGLRREQMHASGHCSGAELAEVTRSVGSKVVIPVHTEHPDSFRAASPKVEVPVKGRPIEIAK